MKYGILYLSFLGVRALNLACTIKFRSVRDAWKDKKAAQARLIECHSKDLRQ